MGEYADDALDDALNGGHWGDHTNWGGRGKRRRPRRKTSVAQPAPLSDFADLIPPTPK